MTAKQWKIIDEEFISYTGGTAQLISNGECKIHLWENPKDAQLFCDKLNAINEENEQLNEKNQKLNEELCILQIDLCKTKSYEQLEKDNKRLKQAYTQLKHRHSLLHDECVDAECDRDSYRKDIASLEKENEQLKSSDTITDLETEIMKLKTTIQQLRTDNTKQKKKLNTTMKENEQLKCGNKNLKATLNDFINILNRLQSNPTDKQTLGVARDMLQNMGKELKE